jgi:cytochrome c-type biogenesis protein CcmE
VQSGSYRRINDGNTHYFRIADAQTNLPARYSGLLPALFREGQGVVAEGSLRDGVFFATLILAKHDENYMPANVAKALKKSGHWHEQD